MPNPIFNNQPKQGGNSIFSLISQLKNGDSKSVFDNLYNSNAQFRDFANSMKGKTPEQAFREKGYDYEQFKGMMR